MKQCHIIGMARYEYANSEDQVQVIYYGQIEEQWKAGTILEHYMVGVFM